MPSLFIDWQDSEVHIYEYERKKGQFVLSQSISIPIDDDLVRSLSSANICSHPDNIILSIPMSLLSLREVTFPFIGTDKISKTIGFELDGLLIGSADDYVIDHVITDEEQHQSKALAVCVLKTKLLEIIDIFSAAGIEPKIITSLDIRLSRGNPDKLFNEHDTYSEARTKAAMEELTSQTLNFRKDAFTYIKDVQRIKRTLHLSFLLILALLIIIGIQNSFKLFYLREEQSQLNKDIQNVYQNAFPEDRRVLDPIRQFTGNLSELNGKKSVLVGIPVLDILRSIAETMKTGIRLYEFNVGKENILIRGTATGFQEVEIFRDSLSGVFDEVNITDSKSSPDRSVSFSMVMRSREA